MKYNTSIQSIKIGFKCTNDWSQMQSIGKNKHCGQCKKIVVNFEDLSQEEIIQYFEKRKFKSICGRFKQTQLKQLNRELAINQSSKLTKLTKPIAFATAFSAMTLAPIKSTAQSNCKDSIPSIEILHNNINVDSAQTTVIKGIILDAENQPLIGANVVIDNTSHGISTDLDGKFQLTIKDSLKTKETTMSTSYPGYEKLTVDLVDVKNKEVKIILKDGFNMENVVLMGAIIAKRPLHKRIWYTIKRIFEK